MAKQQCVSFNQHNSGTQKKRAQRPGNGHGIPCPSANPPSGPHKVDRLIYSPNLVGLYSCPRSRKTSAFLMTSGVRASLGTAASTRCIALTISMPSTTRPNTVCFPSSSSVRTKVRKNWEPPVFLERPLAMLKDPVKCRRYSGW